jgi:hypothetical protein
VWQEKARIERPWQVENAGESVREGRKEIGDREESDRDCWKKREDCWEGYPKLRFVDHSREPIPLNLCRGTHLIYLLIYLNE